jgi:hypothetical protein
LARRAVDAQAGGGEHLLQPLAQRRRRTGVTLIKLRGKLFGVAQPLLGVGVAKGLDQFGIYPRLVLVGQMVSDVGTACAGYIRR